MSPQFPVKIGWPDGSIAEEAIEAPDAALARSEVERRGGHVFEVRRKGLSLSARRGGRRGRVKMTDFLIFNQELIALLKAGLPVVHAFELLLERQESPVLRRVLSDVRERVNVGRLDLRGLRRTGRPLPAALLDVAEGGGEVRRDRERAAPLPEVPEDA